MYHAPARHNLWSRRFHTLSQRVCFTLNSAIILLRVLDLDGHWLVDCLKLDECQSERILLLQWPSSELRQAWSAMCSGDPHNG